MSDDLIFKVVFQESPISITIYNSKGKLIDANKACLDLLNTSDVKDIKGFDIFNDPNLPKNAKERLLAGETVSFEIAYDFSKVEKSLKVSILGVLYFDAIISPIFKPDGSLQYYLNQVTDITKHKKMEMDLEQSESRLEERVKELTCLYGISKLAADPKMTIDQIFEGTLELIPSAWRFPDVICAEIKYNDNIYKTSNFRQSSWKLSTGISVDEKTLEIDIYYLEEKQFLSEEANLLNDIAYRLKTILEQKLVKEQLLRLNRELEDKVEKRTKEINLERERAESYLNLAGVAILTLDTEGNITLLNKKGYEIMQYDEGELLGSNWFETCIPQHRKKEIFEIFKKLMRGDLETTEDVENIILTKNGKERLVAWHNIVLYDESGNIAGTLSSVEDITERKKAEEERNLNSEIMTNLAEGIYLIRSSDLEILWANTRFEEMFGYNPGEMIGKKVVIVNAPTDKTAEETADEIFDFLERTGEWHGEVNNIKKDGTPFWCYANVSVFNHPMYGEVLVSVHTDITERKIAEQKLKISENGYRKAFKQANFYKDLFTHDINNVLNNISASQQLCLLNINDPEKIGNLLDIVKLQVIRGTKLVSNIHKLSQLEEHKISLEKTEVIQILNEAKKFIYTSFYTRKIDIQVDSVAKELLIQANELLLDVFENLLINSVNHNLNQNVEISIKISRVQEQTKNFLKLEFIDNGIGIIDKRKKIIFQKKYKEDISVKGLGFGLTLVKKIIETYGGKIWVEDKVKGDYTKGSNFIISIPEINN